MKSNRGSAANSKRRALSKLPERQFNMLLSGSRKYPRYDYGNYSIPMSPALVAQHQGAIIKVTSIEPALNYLREKWALNIELDQQTRNRLDQFGKPDELYSDLINRLLDIAEAKK